MICGQKPHAQTLKIYKYIVYIWWYNKSKSCCKNNVKPLGFNKKKNYTVIAIINNGENKCIFYDLLMLAHFKQTRNASGICKASEVFALCVCELFFVWRMMGWPTATFVSTQNYFNDGIKMLFRSWWANIFQPIH